MEAAAGRGATEVTEQSFFEASARQRANLLVDVGSFYEILGPQKMVTSPHLQAFSAAVSYDDGVVTGVGLVRNRPVFIISQEGQFIGGAVGEVHGAKMVGVFRAALKTYDLTMEKHPDEIEVYRPAVVISFDTGGVRLHEANAGLLAHAEVLDMLQNTKGKIPVISIIGGKVGCFGGMGFIAAAADAIIMSPKGRLGLTGPEVIEQEMGAAEFNASDKSLVSRTTGGKHKYIMRDCDVLVDDCIGGFRSALCEILSLPYDELCKYRRIGSLELINEQIDLVNLAAKLNPGDAKTVWEYFGNDSPELLPEMDTQDFLNAVRRREREVEQTWKK